MCGESYDCIAKSGWSDTYLLAEKRDHGMTVRGVIDGWCDKIADPESLEGMRIDQIWCGESAPVLSSNVVFNGQNGPVVSDHFGVMIEYD